MAHDDNNAPSKPGRSPPSSLPPDNTGVDLNWDDDVASLEARPPIPSVPVKPANEEFDIGERITKVPEIPMSVLSARLLAEADRLATPAPREPPVTIPDRSEHGPPPKEAWPSQPSLPNTVPDRPEPPRVASSPRTRHPRSSTQGRSSPAPAWMAGLEPAAPCSQQATLRDQRDPPPIAEPARSNAAATQRMALRHEELTLDLADLGQDDTEVNAEPAEAQAPAAPPREDSERPTEPPTSMLEPPPVQSAPDPLRRELRDRYAVGDFSGALEIAERLLVLDGQDADALRYAESCRDVLLQMLTSRVGPLDRTVNTLIAPDQIRWLSLDHRAGFVLSLVDGMSTAEELLDISGMPRLEALRILSHLLERRIVALEPHRPPE